MFEQFDAVYVVFAIGATYSLCSQFIMNKLVDRKKMKEIQEESKRLQKEMSAATKANDEKRLADVSTEYEKFMPKMMEMSFMQLKPLIIIIPALMVLMPFLHENFADLIITLPISLPIIYDGFPKLFSLDIGGFIDGLPYWRNIFGSKGWFWISVIIVSISVSLIRALHNKIKGNTQSSSPSNAGGEEIKGPTKPDLNTGLVEDNASKKEI